MSWYKYIINNYVNYFNKKGTNIFDIYFNICYYIRGDFMNYENKIILITGAYQGIGYSLADFFGRNKATLILTYHNHLDETKKLQEELINKYSISVDIYNLDLCKEDSIINLYNNVKIKYKKIDILINNAVLSLDNDIDNKTKDEFMKVIETNLVGTFLMMKYFDKIIDGYIFNIGSTDGIDTGNIYSIDYNASKAGINSITKTFSLYSKNKIISICPNWVDTESTRSMDSNYLKSELERINQKKLINVGDIPKVIDRCIKDNNETGSIIRIEGDNND